MKSYAEVLRGYVGKKGDLHTREGMYHFIVKKSGAGSVKLVEAGADYAEFVLEKSSRFIHVSRLVVEIE